MSSPLVHPKLNKIDSSMKKMMKLMEKYQYLGEGEIDCKSAISFRYETIKKGEYRLFLKIGLSDVIVKIRNDSAKFLKEEKAYGTKEHIKEIEIFFDNKKENMEEIIKNNSPFFELNKALDNLKSEAYKSGKPTIEIIDIDDEYYFDLWELGCHLCKKDNTILDYIFPSNYSGEFGKFKLTKYGKKLTDIKLYKEYFDNIALKLSNISVSQLIEYCNKLGSLLIKYQAGFIKTHKEEFIISDKIKMTYEYLHKFDKIGLINYDLVSIYINNNYICSINRNQKLHIEHNNTVLKSEYLKNLYEKLEEHYPKFLEEINDMYSLD